MLCVTLISLPSRLYNFIVGQEIVAVISSRAIGSFFTFCLRSVFKSIGAKKKYEESKKEKQIHVFQKHNYCIYCI